MMSLAPIGKSASATNYYKSEGYYKEGTPEHEQSAVWYGNGAARLGLEGYIDDKLFNKMLDGQTYQLEEGELKPGRVIEKVEDGESKSRKGTDLTFNASKYISVAALVYGDDRLIKLHHEAAKETLDYAQKHLVQTRVSANKSMVRETGGDVIIGIFQHDTTRALNAQLHSHSPILNQVYNSKGEYTALYNDAFYTHQKVLSQMYDTRMARGCSELGYLVERVGPERHVRLTEIPEALVKAHSQRSEQIDAKLKEKEMPNTPANRQLAALLTRTAKHKNVDRTELNKVWMAEAKELGVTREDMDRLVEKTKDRARNFVPGQTRAGDLNPTLDARQAVKTAIWDISERVVHYSQPDLQAKALGYAEHADLKQIDVAIASAKKTGELVVVKVPGREETMLSDEKTLLMEKEIAQTFRANSKSRALRLDPYAVLKKPFNLNPDAALKHRLSRTSLSNGQREAVTTALTGKGQIRGVQGYAGTGKTFMVSHLEKEAERAGYEVRGLAPSSKAVAQLSEALPNTETLQAFVARRGHAKDVDPKKTIYVVDEASMIANQDMRDFLRIATKTNTARVVFIGDVQQLDSPSAGTPFELLQKSGMPTAVMDDIKRQKNETALGIVKHAIAGDVGKAFEAIGDNLKESNNIPMSVADAYLAKSASERETVRIITPTNADRREINALVREGLKEEGTLAKDGLVVPALTQIQLTRAQKADPTTWQPGDTVVAHQSYAKVGLKKGHIYEVTESDKKTRTLSMMDRKTGEVVDMELAQNTKSSTAISHYETSEREFTRGDMVKFGITSKTHDITNGQLGRVLGTSENGIEVAIDKGGTKTLPVDGLAVAGMDHAYARTVHDFQGGTVTNILVAMASNGYLTTQKSFYVAVSRMEEKVELYTDNASTLAARLKEQTGRQITALEAYVEGRHERADDAQKDAEKDRDNERSERDEKDAKSNYKNDPAKDRETTPFERDPFTPEAMAKHEERKQELLREIQIQKERGEMQR